MPLIISSPWVMQPGTKSWLDSIVYEYFSVHISEGLEREFREKRRLADEALGRPIFSSNYRWQGYAGEYGLERMLKKYGLKYTYHDTITKRSPLDFTVGKMKIDVKTKSYNRYPPPTFRVDYNDEQFNKNKVITHLVFAGYVEDQRALHITCWNSKEDFIAASIRLNAGEDMISPEGRAYAVTDPMWISDIGKNRPTIELLPEGAKL